MVAGGALVISDDVMIVESFAVMVVLSFDESLLWFWTVQGLSGSPRGDATGSAKGLS